MKKLLFFIGAAWLPVVASAQSAVTSVTYFPTPYVAYNKLNVQNSLSVGLTSGSTEMILGHTQLSSNTPLTTPQTSLKRGNLALDLIADTGFLLDNQNDAPIQLGDGTNGEAVLRFNSNLRVPTVTDALSFHTAKLTTDHIRMFEPRDITSFNNDRHFPSCLKAIKDSDQSYTGNKGYITWENLVLGPCNDPSRPSSTDCVKKAYLVCSGDTCGPNTNADTEQSCDISDLQKMLKGEDGQPSVRPDHWVPGTFLSSFSADGTTRLYTIRTGAAPCGYKTRAYRCDPATHNWVAINGDNGINRNDCFAYMSQELETTSCSDPAVGLPALVPPDGGTAFYEGTATRICHNRCDGDTWAVDHCDDWDKSNCKLVSYQWSYVRTSTTDKFLACDPPAPYCLLFRSATAAAQGDRFYGPKTGTYWSWTPGQCEIPSIDCTHNPRTPVQAGQVCNPSNLNHSYNEVRVSRDGSGAVACMFYLLPGVGGGQASAAWRCETKEWKCVKTESAVQ